MLGIDDADIAVAAEVADCPSGLGVIGAAPGQTLATIRIGGASGPTFPLPITTSDVVIEAALLPPPRIPEGQRHDYPRSSIAYRALDAEGLPIAGSLGGAPVARWLSLDAADHGIATVDVLGEDGWQIVAAGAGETELALRYDAPFGHFSSEPVPLEVMTGGELIEIVGVELRGEDGGPLGVSQALSTGDCADAVLTGRYSLDGTIYDVYDGPVDGVIWTADPPLAPAPDRPARFCGVAAGDATLRGCHALGCRSIGVHVGDGDVVGIAVERTTATAITMSERFAFCAPVRVYADIGGGGREDVTASPALGLSVSVPTTTEGGSFDELWPQDIAADGAPILDASGNPCFRMLIGNRAAGVVESVLSASYVGKRASAPIDIDFGD